RTERGCFAPVASEDEPSALDHQRRGRQPLRKRAQQPLAVTAESLPIEREDPGPVRFAQLAHARLRRKLRLSLHHEALEAPSVAESFLAVDPAAGGGGG